MFLKMLNVLFLLIFFTGVLCFGQGVAQPRSLKDLPASEIFSGPEQAFSIALPRPPTATQTLTSKELGDGAAGVQYRWSLREAFITLSFVSLTGDVGIKSEQNYIDYVAGVKDSVLSVTKGKLLSSAPLKMGNMRGVELVVSLPDGAKVFCRAFPAEYMGRHLQYTLIAFAKDIDPETDRLVAAAVSSLKIWTDDDRAADKARRIAAGTPAALPQSPALTRVSTDAEDAGVKGAVKTVLLEMEYTDPRSPKPIRIKTGEDQYNEMGYLTLHTRFTYRNDPDEIKVFGYLDGARVSKNGYVRYAYEPPAPLGPKPILDAPPPAPRDKRYTTKYAFSYDKQKRLIEFLEYPNDGSAPYRESFVYNGDKIEISSFYNTGKPVDKEILTVDKDGLVLSKTSVSGDGSSSDRVFTYKYEAFDKQGNWTKRSVTATTGSNYVEYRTLAYY